MKIVFFALASLALVSCGGSGGGSSEDEERLQALREEVRSIQDEMLSALAKRDSEGWRKLEGEFTGLLTENMENSPHESVRDFARDLLQTHVQTRPEDPFAVD